MIDLLFFVLNYLLKHDYCVENCDYECKKYNLISFNNQIIICFLLRKASCIAINKTLELIMNIFYIEIL